MLMPIIFDLQEQELYQKEGLGVNEVHYVDNQDCIGTGTVILPLGGMGETMNAFPGNISVFCGLDTSYRIGDCGLGEVNFFSTLPGKTLLSALLKVFLKISVYCDMYFIS